MDTRAIKIYEGTVELMRPDSFGTLYWSPDGTRILYYHTFNEVRLVDAEGKYTGYIRDLIENQVDGKTSRCKLYQAFYHHSPTTYYLSGLDNTNRIQVQIGRSVPIPGSPGDELFTPIEGEPNHFLTSFYRHFLWSPCQEWAITQCQSGPYSRLNEENKRWLLVQVNGTRRYLLPEGLPISWSPLESTFTYWSQRSVYLFSPKNVDTPRKIIEGASSEVAWHPSGKELVFERESSLYITDLHGHVRHIGKKLDSGPLGFYGVYQVQYSPDGQQITFMTDCPTAEHDQVERIYTLRPDGSDLQFLTEGICYSWSYDSRWIFYNKPVYPGFRKATNQLMQISRYRQDEKQIAEGYKPAASPKARKLAFCNEDAIWVMNY